MVILTRHAVRLVGRASSEVAAGGRQEWGMETRCFVGARVLVTQDNKSYRDGWRLDDHVNVVNTAKLDA